MLFACIATGPSLTQADCDRVQALADFVIAVNDAYALCPEADALYACDPHWWRAHHEATAAFARRRWTQQQYCRSDAEEVAVCKEYGLQHVVGENKPGLGHERIHYGGTSGYQAVNLAYLWGAKRIILLGYDYQLTGGQKHFFGDHPKPMDVISPWPEFAANFDCMDIVNCSRATAINAFPRSTVESLHAV